MGYLANYGYSDGSGDWYIRIDTELCTGCGDCVTVCPAGLIELTEDEFDPLSEEMVVVIKEAHRKTIKYDCGPCKPVTDRPPLPCVAACEPEAIIHSW
ncbi:MAG: 4Fe-4S binding protein [Anaerolineae bacterium]